MLPDGLGPMDLIHPHAAGMPMHQHRMLLEDRFLEMHRYPNNKPMIFNQNPMNHQQHIQHNAPPGPPDAPRYTKWRERRDVITNLDRQTAQSSSKTDSFKTSLQQKSELKDKRQNQQNQQPAQQQRIHDVQSNSSSSSQDPDKQRPKSPKKESSGAKKAKRSEKTDPQDISDGEIIDDESSSDDDSTTKNNLVRGDTTKGSSTAKMVQDTATNKRRRLCGDAELDYETISDEELDSFMSEKKEDPKTGRAKTSSEIELLNALGLDWANLVEMSKQSKKEANTSGSALKRFSIANYLPTLDIPKKLAGPEIYELITKICHPT